MAPAWVLLDACDPVQAKILASGSNYQGQALGWVPSLEGNATYYIVVTTDPGVGQPSDNCGPFQMSIQWLPVELQSFIIE